jgi:hypothetical protein
MNKIFGIAIIALLGFCTPASAQDSKVEKGAKKALRGTKKASKAVGNKTAQVASKGAASVTDKRSDNWIGPNGQTIYIDDLDRYYWINGRGKHIYVSKSALRAKTKQ